MKVLFGGNEINLLGKQLKVGDKFPDFKVVGNSLNELSKKDFNGKTVYITVPSIDTGVCSIEVAKFMNYFKNLEGRCLVVSMDLPFALARWCQSNVSKKVITASDFRYHEFAKVTGSMLDGVGLLTRAVFVVNENGTVEHVEYCSNVHEEPNYDEVLKFFK